ncbi:cell cycle control cwf14 protein [Rutstroemia sp. NJR-2017a BBW]|nr:cell cycle control cwf14 protein [Rutstroemia sp. NJR-2017a BBW]
MPAIRHSSKRKAPPAGYSDIEDTLLTYSNQMKDAVAAPAPTGPRHQATWNITAIVHKRSRYIWDLYREEKISKELYDWCVKNGQCDAMLVAKWKKNGYAVSNASTRKKQTSTQHAYVACPRPT